MSAFGTKRTSGADLIHHPAGAGNLLINPVRCHRIAGRQSCRSPGCLQCYCGSFQPTRPSTLYRLLLTIAIRVELADVSPQVFLLLLVLNAREDHFSAWHFSRRIFDVVLERLFIPHDARAFVRIGIVEIQHRAGLTAVEAIEFRADLVLSPWTDRVTGQADIEYCLSLLRILRHRWDGYSRDQNGRQDWRV